MNPKPRRILVTGATGFVGRQIVRALAAHNSTVVLVVREGKEHLIETSPCIDKVLSTRDAFAETPGWWEKVCSGVDTVIHAAWYAEPGYYLQSSKNLDCLLGTLEFARGAVNANVRRFIGVGTCFEYDLSCGMLQITTPLRPVTPYAAAKASAFMTLSQYLPAARVEFGWARLFFLYGEGENERRLAAYIRKQLATGQPAELTSGHQIRDFLDVRIAGHKIVELALGSRQGAVNICSGHPITVRQFAEQIADEYGRRDLLKFGIRPDNYLDPPVIIGEPTN